MTSAERFQEVLRGREDVGVGIKFVLVTLPHQQQVSPCLLCRGERLRTVIAQ